jgi:hypothetical protein
MALAAAAAATVEGAAAAAAGAAGLGDTSSVSMRDVVLALERGREGALCCWLEGVAAAAAAAPLVCFDMVGGREGGSSWGKERERGEVGEEEKRRATQQRSNASSTLPSVCSAQGSSTPQRGRNRDVAALLACAGCVLEGVSWGAK